MPLSGRSYCQLFVILTHDYFLCSGNENIIIYACDCSTETLERAKDILNDAGFASLKDRFHPFYCDFSISKFPTWLACNSCRGNTFQQQQSFTTPGCYFIYLFRLINMQDYCFSLHPYSSFSIFSENDGSPATGSLALEESGCCIGGVDFITLVRTSFSILI